jgi:hypothetical protein
MFSMPPGTRVQARARKVSWMQLLVLHEGYLLVYWSPNQYPPHAPRIQKQIHGSWFDWGLC